MRTLEMSKYIESKIDNNRYCKSNGHFTRHLLQFGLTYQQYYEQYVTGKKELCSCGNPKTFYQKTETYANSCGSPKCVGNVISDVKCNWTHEQRVRDSQNKSRAFLARTPEQVQEQRTKSQQTQIERYGDVITRTEAFKEKSRNTKLAKYGNEYYSGWEKSAEANRNKTVVEQDEINNRRRQTNLELYGVENCFMRPDVVSKARQGNSTGRDYIFPSGRMIGIRGYENIVLDKLLETHKETQLLVDDRKTKYCLPVFEYVNVNQHRRKYYPDIYIPDENKIIEVKSQWWWDGKGDNKYSGRLENNQRKARSVIDQGYKYEVWLFTDKTNYEILTWK